MSEKERAVFKIFINGKIEDVWHEITKTDENQQAFFNMRLYTDGLKPGGKVRMRSGKNGKYTGAVGEILEYDPPHRYAHTFQFTQYDDPPCKVIYELEKVNGGVEFRMILEDLTPGTKSSKQMKQGGNMILNTLKAMVENGKPSVGTRMLFLLFKVLGIMTPKRCLTENWP